MQRSASMKMQKYVLNVLPQVLREVNFAPDILKRRPEQGESKPPQPEDVQLWTNHRTMEWLRSCNLSEYAPNLRGSGVHGGLIILGLSFTGCLKIRSHILHLLESN